MHSQFFAMVVAKPNSIPEAREILESLQVPEGFQGANTDTSNYLVCSKKGDMFSRRSSLDEATLLELDSHHDGGYLQGSR